MEMFSPAHRRRDARAARRGRAHALHRPPRGRLRARSCEQMDWAEAADRRERARSRCSSPSTTAGAPRSSTPRARFRAATRRTFRALLYAPEMHDPDLIIRTSGERRLSNYLLWQSAYSELVFRDELWPDFTREAFEQSLAEFSARRRRFGGADGGAAPAPPRTARSRGAASLGPGRALPRDPRSRRAVHRDRGRARSSRSGCSCSAPSACTSCTRCTTALTRCASPVCSRSPVCCWRRSTAGWAGPTRFCWRRWRRCRCCSR